MRRFWRNRGALLRWLLAGLAETAVVIPWLLLLYGWGGDPAWLEAVPGAWLPLTVFLAAALWESGSRSESPAGRVAALLAGAVLAYLAAYALLPAPARAGVLRPNLALAFLPVGAYLWYRGARSAIEGLEYGRLFERIWIPFGSQLAGIVLLLVLGTGREGQVQLLLVWAVLLLFAAGLTLLVLTRERALLADESSREQAGTGAASPVVSGLVLGLVALTLGASSVLTVDRLSAGIAAVGRVASPAALWLVDVAMLIVVRWAMLLAPLFDALRLMASGRVPEPPETEEGAAAEPIELPPVAGPTADYTPLVKAILLVLAVGLLAVWLYRLNRGRRAEVGVEEERTSLGLWRSLWQDLRSLLGRRAPGAAGAGRAAEEAVDPRSARGLYRRLQRWGAAQGRPRGIAETPNRYRSALAERHPEAQGPVEAVTAVYNQARYGGTPPDPEAVAAAGTLLDDCCGRDFTK